MNKLTSECCGAGVTTEDIILNRGEAYGKDVELPNFLSHVVVKRYSCWECGKPCKVKNRRANK